MAISSLHPPTGPCHSASPTCGCTKSQHMSLSSSTSLCSKMGCQCRTISAPMTPGEERVWLSERLHAGCLCQGQRAYVVPQLDLGSTEKLGPASVGEDGNSRGLSEQVPCLDIYGVAEPQQHLQAMGSGGLMIHRRRHIRRQLRIASRSNRGACETAHHSIWYRGIGARGTP